MALLNLFSLLLLSLLLNHGSTQEAQSQQVIRLEHDCYPPYYGYVLPPSNCTCSKVDPQSPGEVQWVYPDGTTAKQVKNLQTKASILVVTPPSQYALNQTYICRPEGTTDQNRDQIIYNPQFIFGPQSAVLEWAQNQKEPIQRCQSGATKELIIRCEVPSKTINPGPVYTAFVDGRVYGGYDKLPGQLIEADSVWRLEMVFTLSSAGNHTVSCHVRNMYASANWFTLSKNIAVSDQPPSSIC